jgi:2-polyprenyl-3-methyl-5-hydroxy-6-metoxy-1,4-benzoquinol methylase
MANEGAGARHASDDAAERARRAYDAAPYRSVALMRLHPARLAGHAQLLGFDPPPLAKARVLEIGCASGGHIVPLAAAFPEARFLGVDVSPRQIEEGVGRIARLGLRNIVLSARSLTEIGAADGEFDYIIAHGLYSWIPEDLRAALLEVCGQRLSENGVALISYNVLPGWRLFQAVRDSMMLHAGGDTDLQARSAKTRRLFALMKEHADPETSYGRFWRDEAQKMAAGDDAYFTHEIFEETNAPTTFRDFSDAASRHGLAYLAESRVRGNRLESLAPGAAAMVEDVSDGEPLAREQYLDIVSGRTFRESMLVRAAALAKVELALDEGRLAALHLIAPIKLEVRRDAGAASIVADEVSMGDVPSACLAAVERLIERRPSSSELADILPPEADAETRAALLALLMRMAQAGLLDVSAEPTICAQGLAARPRAWPLAASDAGAGALTATLRHAPFHMDPLDRLLLPKLDGLRNRDSLVDFVLAEVAAGRLQASGRAELLADRKAMRAALAAEVDRRLGNYARIGLLARD